MIASVLGTTRIGGTLFEWGRRTYVMGVINVTPDSFSGDGLLDDTDAAVKRALQFQDWGADIIDVGGESTRFPPVYQDSRAVPWKEELSRVVPVVTALAERLHVPISIDTYKARVAAEALKVGASMINDVWGFQRDSEIADVAAEASVPVVLMHNQSHTRYDDLVPEVIRMLERVTDDAVRFGVELGNIVLDPGIGFGKTPEQNLEVMRRLNEFRPLKRPLLIGTSRKSTIGHVLGLPVDDRLEGTAATVALAIDKGADIVRVHDVREMVRVARMSDAIVRGWSRG